MYFDSFTELLAMEGHGVYVWGCYAIALAVLLFNVVSPLLKRRQFFREQSRRLKRQRQAKQQS